MGQLAAKMAGFDGLKKDVEDLKKAAELMRGINGHLEGKADMVKDGFNKLVEAKAMVDSQIGSAFNAIDQASGLTQNLLSRIAKVETELEDIKRKAGQAKGIMDAGKKFKDGNIAGGLNDLKDKGIGGFTGGAGFGGGGGFTGGFGF